MNAGISVLRKYMHKPHSKMPFKSTRISLYMRNNTAHAHGLTRFSNVKCFYCMTLGHTSNVYYYKKLHLNMLPLNIDDINQTRPLKICEIALEGGE